VLQLFFEGVQAKVAQGVKESEISYQMAYSKQELRKVIREYPAREVKKGLDNLYRKVEKHLCEEENLLQVCVCVCFFPGEPSGLYFNDMLCTYKEKRRWSLKLWAVTNVALLDRFGLNETGLHLQFDF
jgi:hypothetical protein